MRPQDLQHIDKNILDRLHDAEIGWAQERDNECRVSRRKINDPGWVSGENMPLLFVLIYYFQHPFGYLLGQQLLADSQNPLSFSWS